MKSLTRTDIIYNKSYRNKKKGNRVETIDGFIFIMEYLKRSEQKDGFL